MDRLRPPFIARPAFGNKTINQSLYCFFLTFSVNTPDGTLERSDWPDTFTEEFEEYIYFSDSVLQVKETGLALLQKNEAGIQLVNASGKEVFSYREPKQAGAAYTGAELLRLYQIGKLEGCDMTAFHGRISSDGIQYHGDTFIGSSKMYQPDTLCTGWNYPEGTLEYRSRQSYILNKELVLQRFRYLGDGK